MGGLLSTSEPVDMDSAVAQEVQKLIASDDVVIFSKTYCPYCTMAKDVFNSINKKFTLMELDQRQDGTEIQNILGQMTGAKTVPRVFIKGSCVGGGTDVQALQKSGKLLPLLA